jgi:hypothetical protein
VVLVVGGGGSIIAFEKLIARHQSRLQLATREVALLEGGARIDDPKGANVFALAAKHLTPPRESAVLHVRVDGVEAQPRVREHADDALVYVRGLVLAQPHRDDTAEEEIDGPNVGIPLALFVADLAVVEKRIHDDAPGPLPANCRLY